MKTFPLELSPQVRQGRYANFSRAADSGGHIFMAGYEECAADYFIERSDFPFQLPPHNKIAQCEHGRSQPAPKDHAPCIRIDPFGKYPGQAENHRRNQNKDNTRSVL